MTATAEPHDVITMGRIGVDIYPLQTGVPLPQVETFGKFLGGSATNVAVAAARLGHSSAVISRTGNDPFGEYCHQALRGFGVDDRWVTPVTRYPTPVTFCEIFPPDNFPLYFYREPKAPDLELRPEDLDFDAVDAARVFWVTGTGLCAEPSRTATLTALEARSGGAGNHIATVFDMDWRPMFWGREGDSQSEHPSESEVMAEARPYYRQALALA
ncbi:MAG TPA: PfkB family carbohydrate kinase, partial [Streptomyces sp.]|nr:PfkB family carbohydrate kinase [Streptomyces sp.]